MKRLFLFLLVLLLFLGFNVSAASVTLTWDPNPETDIAGYRVYWGTATRTYSTNVFTADTTLLVNDLPYGTLYFFAVTAINTSGLESDYSNEVQWSPKPSPPRGLTITQETVEWRFRTNKINPLTITPSAVVKIEDGTVVTGTVQSPGGSINRNVTASNGEAVLQGRAFTSLPADLSVTITKVTQSLASTFTYSLP